VIKAKGKRQKAKGKSTRRPSFRTFAFCLLPFAFCLDCGDSAPGLLLGCSRSNSSSSSSTPPAHTQGFPVTLRDDIGHAVTVPSEPHRIVALLPSHTETLFALGLGDRVVGVDDNSDYPAEAKKLPRLGALYDPRVEQILALAPDLVLASEAGPAPERLAQLGLVVWAGSATRLDDVYRVVETVGKLAGKSAEAAALATRIRADVDEVARGARALPRVRVYDELDPTPYTVGPGSFVGALLDLAGGDNVIPAGLGDFPRISSELVIARDPEVMIGLSLTDALRRPGWSSITAVKRGAVEMLTPAEQGLVSRPGPRLAEGLSVLVRHLHRTPDPPREGGP
jgi:iron complex transport system substrate-binding protein